jgi:integrase
MARRFGMTPLQSKVQDYLIVRRTLGYRLEREGMWLPDFVSFLEQRGSEFITTELALAWATQSTFASAQSQGQRLTMVRNFAKHLRGYDPRTEIPSPDLIPVFRQRLTPYIYSMQEIRALLQACFRLNGPLKPHTYHAYFGLLAVTGMRLSEATDLDCCDVEMSKRILTIRNSKFGKSREVPVHLTTMDVLREYAKKRNESFPRAKSPSFFLSQSGTRLLSQNIWKTFDCLRAWAHLGQPDLPSPRIHDLRHTFAVRTLTRWQSEEAGVSHRIAILSTYLGHVNPSSTYWYLTGTPELLGLAAKRLETFSGDLL